jgi:SdiA-regulated
MKRLIYVCFCVPLVSALGVSPVRAATGKVVRVKLTSAWSTPSPDPMGITYDSRTHRLLVCDSEVDEMPSLWKGSNLFVVRRKGNLVAARTLKKFSVEPADVTLTRGRSLYIADDDRDRIFRDTAGKDGLFGTRDDVATAVLRTRRFGSFDPEGLAWVPRARMLIVTDGADAAQNARVYTIRQGKDHRFGTSDDVVRHFGIHRYGYTDADGVAVTRFSHHLLIVSDRQSFILETTMGGRLVRKIDISATGIKAASGITFAPGTDGSPSRLYITDRGVDNNVNPHENDGKLFELKIA